MQRNDPRFLPQIRQTLYTAVLSDVLDESGFSRPGDAALDPAAGRRIWCSAGFARTGLYRESAIASCRTRIRLRSSRSRWYDDLKADEVAVFGCGGSTPHRAVGQSG